MSSVPEVEMELRLAKEYWLKTVWPYIAGRKLRGIELFVAEDAYYLLRNAQGAATGHRVSDPLLVSADALVDFAKDEFRKPEELCRDENLKPETLAGIAAPMMPKPTANLTPIAAVGVAHELLMAAERYVKSLPEQKTGAEQVGHDIGLALSSVQFADILSSNRRDSGELPLLLGVFTKSRDLTMPALRAAVKRFLEEKKRNWPNVSEDEWNREREIDDARVKSGLMVQLGSGRRKSYQEWKREPEEALNDALQNNRIILQDLCKLRWQRFKNFWEKQSRAGSQKRRKTRKPRKSK